MIPDEQFYIEAIMKPKYQIFIDNGITKYQNNKFEIVKKQNTMCIIDKRIEPNKIHLHLKSAFNNIVKEHT